MACYLLRGATVVDGSGAPARRADVTVEGGAIASVTERAPEAGVVVDADGLVLAPGFIDIHSHSDSTVFRHPLLESKAFQGVTLEVTGNCGLGLFPVPAEKERFAEYLRVHDFALPRAGFTWDDFDSYARFLEAAGTALHHAPLLGHGALRQAVLGAQDRQATEAELEKMCRILDQALAQGAWGMSTGLIYPPGSYAGKEELVSLARVLARRDALYTSHIRSEGEGLFSALEEAITVGRESGARVEVSHLKAMGRINRGRAGELLQKLAEARGGGISIGADQYPYHASATTLTAVVPAWAHEGGVQGLLKRLQAPELRERLRGEVARQIEAREGAAGIMVSNCASQKNRHLSGLTLEEIAARWNCPPEEAALRLIEEEEGAVGGIFFSMAEQDVEKIIANPEVAVGSDGHGLNAASAAGEATHPRSYGTFPRVLGHYAREKGILSLECAVHKMTGLPAARLGLGDRGLVRPGYAADLVLFDPATVADRADYPSPHRYAEGVVHLLVAGEPVVWDGKLTGKMPGRVLRRPTNRQKE